MLVEPPTARFAVQGRRAEEERMMRTFRSHMSRRDAIALLSAGAGFGLLSALREGSALAFGQAGGWYSAASPTRPTFSNAAVIRTILRDIRAAELTPGSVQIHEHIGGIFRPTPPPPPGSELVPGVVAPGNEAEYLALMIDELKMSRAEGVSCLVDAAASGRRDNRTLENLKHIATQSGMHIVVAGGYYQDLAIPARYPADIVQMAEEPLSEQFVADAGIQRWGAFGEIASSPQMQAEERKLIRAIGKAHLRTNLPIFTHTPHQSCPSCALEQLDVFESVGVDPRRVAIGHLTAIRPDAEPLAQTAKALAKRGAFLGFDTVGHLMGRSAIPEAHKVKYVLAVLDAGFEDHLLFSADSTPVPQLKANWGQGYSSVVTQFVPKLRYAGVKDALLHKILVDNPRRFLSFIPAGRS
jgi:phosphotriesterase-related protein